MHTYDPSRPRPAYQSPIPSMRTAQESTDSHSATPIYDTLYSEYRRAFRALPGDRSGEEDMGFIAFGTGSYGFQHRGDGRYDSRHDQRYGSYGHFQVARYGQHEYHPTGHHQFPAALPPGPPREH
ncbi:hypothetical protein ACFVYR_22280 [Streptomyces sp. NPDC058284]|uniref:hypothetical protein n=1 Tax=unclassified Streptomyces TaxID=2593676 RepID=UPI0036679D28